MNRRYFLALLAAFTANATEQRNTIMRQSALFISHGSPMNIIDDNPYTQSNFNPLCPLGDKPETIHDFFWFS